MSEPAPKLATYDDLLAFPEDVRAEILAGRVVVSPSPLPKHAKVQRALGHFVGGPYDDDDGYGGPGGWWIFVEVDVELGMHEVVRPDLAGWRRERLLDPGDKRPIRVAPDWICEISSPSTVRRDRGIKRDLYARSGVAHYWIVDVDSRLVEVFALQQGRWVLHGSYDEGATAVRLPPFDAVELDVSRLFLPQSG